MRPALGKTTAVMNYLQSVANVVFLITDVLTTRDYESESFSIVWQTYVRT